MNQAIEEDIVHRTPTGWYGLAVPHRWHSIIEEAHCKIKELHPNYKVYQIKAKFGQLRYYCSVESDELVRNIIQEAENKVYELERELETNRQTLDLPTT